ADLALDLDVEQAARGHGVVAVIPERVAYRVRHYDRSSEMDDAFDFVRMDDALDEVFVGGVADEQRHAFGQEVGKAGRQIVDHDDAFAGIDQRANHVTSD